MRYTQREKLSRTTQVRGSGNPFRGMRAGKASYVLREPHLIARRCEEIMRIRMVSDKKIFVGTPTEIVQKMRELDHGIYESLDAYIQNCCLRLKDVDQKIQVSGQTEEERAFSFLKGLVEKGQAKLDVDSPEHVDRFSVSLLRTVLKLSQERLAQEIGVTFSTVNRWERGRTQLGSAAVAHSLSRLARKLSN